MIRLRLAFFALLIFTVVFGAGTVWWLMHPSRVFYTPVAATIEKNEAGNWTAVVTRTLPRGDVWVRWSATVWVRRDGDSVSCTREVSEPTLYLENNGPTIFYELPDNLARCMDEAPPISITWSRQVMLFGWLPLIPVDATISIHSNKLRINGDS